MSSHSVGLGIHTQAFYGDSDEALSDPEPRDVRNTGTNGKGRAPRRVLTGPRAPKKSHAVGSRHGDHDRASSVAPSGTNDSLGMRTSQYKPDHTRGSDSGDPAMSSELLRNISGGASRLALEPMPPPRESDLPRVQRRMSAGDCSKISTGHSHGNAFPRDVTLLSFGGSHARSAAELKSLLGNSHARLKSGAVILPEHTRDSADKKTRKEHGVALEQAKSRARVEVDIVLESDVCVQGGYLRGHIKLRVRKRSRKEGPILLSEGKVRVVGYESVSSEDEHHTFYHYAAPLSSITDSCRNLYNSEADGEGFSTVVEGVHVLPFALQLPTDNSFGCPKGVVVVGSGISVRYIAIMYVGTRTLGHP